jgi:hypothetical protein
MMGIKKIVVIEVSAFEHWGLLYNRLDMHGLGFNH